MSIIRIIFLTLLLTNAEPVLAYRLLDVDYLGMTAARFGCNRDPIAPQYNCGSWTGRAEVLFNFSILDYMYWNNVVHTEGIESQVKTVGWQWELGLRLHEQFFLFHRHHSRHLMEEESMRWVDKDNQIRDSRYPLENSYGFRLNIFINSKPRKGILD